MLPEVGAGKWREGQGSVTHEASDGVGVQTKQKRNEEVMRVPESFEGLLSNTVMSSRVH